MKLSELFTTLECIRTPEGQAGDLPVVIAYRDAPEHHYVFDDVVIMPAASTTNNQGKVVLVAG